MKYSELIADFARLIGIEGDVAFDDEGVWRIGTEDIVFAFREIAETDSLLVYSSIGPLPVTGAESFKTAVLRANFVGQGVPDGAFSLDDDDRVWVHRFFDLKALDASGLADAFEGFVELVLNWRRLRESNPDTAEETGRESEEAGREAESPAAYDNYFNPSGFIRV